VIPDLADLLAVCDTDGIFEGACPICGDAFAAYTKSDLLSAIEEHARAKHG
jgi:hypothetical protein